MRFRGIGYRVFLFLTLVIIFSCQEVDDFDGLDIPELMLVPAGFPEVPVPEDNAFTQARWELGKKLFFDPIMSADLSVSCASCHKPELAFSDNLATTPGVEGLAGTRNSPTLTNIAYHPYYTREGGVPTLEMQILVPIQEHNELGTNILIIAERLNQDPEYMEMARDAYDRDPDPFVITRAISCFERSLLSGNSRYDQFEFQGIPNALEPSEIRGMELFNSERTNCSGCHGGFNFTNYAFENNGLYEEYEDEGRFRLTGEEADRAKFKVPSLRNVGITAPYMHDGSLNTLEEVLDHYISGGEDHINKSDLIQPLDLTQQEKEDLISFLNSLSDASFISNPNFINN